MPAMAPPLNEEPSSELFNAPAVEEEKNTAAALLLAAARVDELSDVNEEGLLAEGGCEETETGGSAVDCAGRTEEEGAAEEDGADEEDGLDVNADAPLTSLAAALLDKEEDKDEKEEAEEEDKGG